MVRATHRGKSPLAPLFQRGEEVRHWPRCKPPFYKRGLGGFHSYLNPDIVGRAL